MDEQDVGRVGVVGRVMSILGAFDATHRTLTLSQVSERSGLPLTTAHRLIAQLVASDVLVRRSDHAYVIGRRMWDLGLLASANAQLRQVASPFLHDLYAATLATVHLAQRDGTRVLYLDRLSGHASMPIVSTVGDRLPLHATGVGKVLLAHAPQPVRDQVFAALERITAFTVCQPGVLAEQLHRVRRDGYATTNEEMSLGACSVAVPIHGGRDHEVVASLGLVVPSLRRDRPRLIAAANVAARGISRSLGAVESRH